MEKTEWQNLSTYGLFLDTLDRILFNHFLGKNRREPGQKTESKEGS